MKTNDYRMFNISFTAMWKGKMGQFTMPRQLLLAAPARIPMPDDLDVRLAVSKHCEKHGAALDFTVTRIVECSDYRASY